MSLCNTGSELLLRHHEMAADPSVLNLCYSFGLDGPLDIEAFRWALRALVEVYPELGCIPEDDSALLIHQEIAGDECERLPGLIELERRKPFDLAAGLLVRARIFRLSPVQHMLILCFHHSGADGWSLGLYARYLTRAYQAATDGTPLDNTRAPETGALRSEGRRARDEASLRTVLEGIDSRAVDPFGAQTVQSSNLLSWNVPLDADFVFAVQSTAKRLRTTAFGLVVTATANWLHQRFSTDRIVIGTTVLGRRSVGELAAGGARYQGALLPLQESDRTASRVAIAIAAMTDRALFYEEQLGILSSAMGINGVLEPAVFVLADCHPMSTLNLKNVKISMVTVPEPATCMARPAHSLSCGRIALFWRGGEGGGALTTFCEPALLDEARLLHSGVLQDVSESVGAVPRLEEPIIWGQSLIKRSPPPADTLSPVAVPGTHFFNRNSIG
ncbi:MAG: condensation domain-containing protein [Edaphobacter sp.]|uniref:condensation domain-containing protein n=1 Tax=Edaphobacter sp. TaxID=1934404 RepID=UPI002982566D|nr:condensation domain-containing protein [Edaphobacter sp.]MDW5265516.1 condensation domain-containing protein [Edaphobacter sp.]